MSAHQPRVQLALTITALAFVVFIQAASCSPADPGDGPEVNAANQGLFAGETCNPLDRNPCFSDARPYCVDVGNRTFRCQPCDPQIANSCQLFPYCVRPGPGEDFTCEPCNPETNQGCSDNRFPYCNSFVPHYTCGECVLGLPPGENHCPATKPICAAPGGGTGPIVCVTGETPPDGCPKDSCPPANPYLVGSECKFCCPANNEGCSPPTPFCNAQGRDCGKCSPTAPEGSNGCTPDKPVCIFDARANPTAYICVEKPEQGKCLKPAFCPQNLPYFSNEGCQKCCPESNEGCEAPTPVCTFRSNENVCGECKLEAAEGQNGCPEAKPICKPGSGETTPFCATEDDCKSHEDCTTNPQKPNCNQPDLKKCDKACKKAEDCQQSKRPFEWSCQDGFCTEGCFDDKHCGDDLRCKTNAQQKRVCVPANWCQKDEHCAANKDSDDPETKRLTVCDTDHEQCVECFNSDKACADRKDGKPHCSSPDPFPSTHFCAECFKREHCTDGKVCNDDHVCVAPDDCLVDCGYCGDGNCDPDENSDNCQEDCGYCGDEICGLGETVQNCIEDCGYCGDEICDAGANENSSNCPEDCGYCGDEECGPGETIQNCIEDCGYCGDGICDASANEKTSNCPQDCGYCGDEVCGPGETIQNCIDDCGYCGDGVCDAGANEHASNCPSDCGFCGDAYCDPSRGEDSNSCPQDCAYCGDGYCSGGEDGNSCPQDCAYCGDGSCNNGEDGYSCPQDCSYCGDGSCDWGEDGYSCPQDCVYCGDGYCDYGEDSSSCPQDCAYCGNGVCDWGEDPYSCPYDCDNGAGGSGSGGVGGSGGGCIEWECDWECIDFGYSYGWCNDGQCECGGPLEE